MKKTLLCHFYNEEYMLPWFLNHHKEIFDHGVMIDYHSTDRSRDIIQEICPNWDIVTSRNPNFQADLIDVEVNDIEASIEGWKICLNVTEQLIGDYTAMDDAESEHILIPSIFMVDTDREQTVTHDLPLYKQKHHGFVFSDSNQAFLERRARRLHKGHVPYPTSSTGDCMAPGRHYNFYTTDKLAILYYGWCPFDEGGIARKLQIQTQIPLLDRQRGWGYHHITNKETLIYRLENEFVPRARDISKELAYYVDKHENFSNIL
jgi:hypothetical protein